MRLKIPIETRAFDPEGRGHGTTRTALSRLLLSRTVHCRSRMRRLQGLIAAMALQLSVASSSQPYRIGPGDFSYVTVKTGGNY